MAKDKLNNLLKFTEYDHLQPKQKPTKKTEIGGFAVLEEVSVKELIKQAAAKTGKTKKELKNLSAKKLKALAGIKKQKGDGEPHDVGFTPKPDAIKELIDKDEKKNESLLLEKKKASAKQKAARARFMEMINAKKKGKKEDKEEKE